MPDNKWENMRNIAQRDLEALKKAEESYGNSWKRRGGVGAFMMLARKFDRIEHQSERHGWDVFEAGEAFKGEAGLLDDIRDLRRYLILVEDHILYNEENQNTEEVKWEYSTGSSEEEQQVENQESQS
jgi:hypothetical protein|tara:strand:+ start:4579 stop:4959 length:381 start_codon:yes stop_codon:yes gene_type:complete